MEEINIENLSLVAGSNGADPNSQLLHDLGNNMAWGAGLGTAFGGGVGGALTGAVGGALQTVGQGLIDHGPVNVPVPVLIGPSWNGSSRPPKPLICMSKQGQYESYCNGL
ncbi:MAG: microcin [Serratia sp. (in: enterobacteria)]|uniref:E492 group microcin n=1 Tax=Serratia sp. (in: enterobacteria) TaxID=616 RepID=UPI003F2FA26D